MDKDDFLGSLDNEIALWIIGTLLDLSKLFIRLTYKPAVARTEHDRHIPDEHLVLLICLFHTTLVVHIGNIYVDWCRIGKISDPTFVGCKVMEPGILVYNWLVHINIIEPHEEIAVARIVTANFIVFSDHVLNLDIDEIVERVNVLLKESSQS